MSSSVQRNWSVVGLAVCTAVLFAAVFSSQAKATEVLPAQAAANTTANVALQANELSWFKPNNAYFQNATTEIAIGCTASTASFQIPPSAAGTWSLNQNKTNIGTHSNGPGGVIADIANGEPDFTGCNVYTNGVSGLGVTVATLGEWTATFHSVDDTNPIAAITVPAQVDNASGVVITITVPGVGNCDLNVVQGKPQSVIGEIVNGTDTTDAQLNVDSQLKFAVEAGAGVCALLGFDTTSVGGDGEAISQYEAKYNVTSAQGAFRVIP